MTEREYRALLKDSYSTIKDFIKSRKKYHKKYILSQEVEDEEDDVEPSMQFGSLLDTMVFSPEERNTRYIVATCPIPTGQMLTLCQALHRRTKQSTDETGRVTREFVSLIEEAYRDVAFDQNGNQVAFKQKGMTFEKVVQRFADEGSAYYEHLRTAEGKVVIDPQDEIRAEEAYRTLQTHYATRGIINARTDENKEVHDQLIIEWEYRGLQMKSMLDRVIVDHTEKKIYQYDLKTAWNLDGFHYNYLKLCYYIQVACYGAAILKWVQEKGYEDYEIVPMKFS